ncbi:MAG: glycosyltransferase family 4 protein [Pyrinomonadaceae bacterium]
MSRIAIVTSHVTTGASVSSDVLGMHRVLENQGYESRVYAESWDLSEPRIWSISEIGEFLTGPNDILLYHHSIGWEPGLQILGNSNCKTVVKYHNITPAEFFAGFSQWHEEKCREGRQQFKLIAPNICDLYLCDSEYNRRELLLEGYRGSNSFVVPPFHNIDAWDYLDADLTTLDKYRDGRTNIVSVSRVAPHKGHRELIEAFAIYHHEYNPDSRLLIIGREEPAFATYSAELRDLSRFLLLGDAVVFAGEVSDAALKAVYLVANAFAFASEHEGFCVPLVEAMAMKVPVITYASTAIPETAGEAAIVLHDRDSALMAESINLVVQDEATNVALGMAGRRRYEEFFTNEKIAARLLKVLVTLN